MRESPYRVGCILNCAFYKFLEVQNYEYIIILVKKGIDFDSAVPSVLGCISARSKCGIVPNELVHRAGPHS